MTRRISAEELARIEKTGARIERKAKPPEKPIAAPPPPPPKPSPTEDLIKRIDSLMTLLVNRDTPAAEIKGLDQLAGAVERLVAANDATANRQMEQLAKALQGRTESLDADAIREIVRSVIPQEPAEKGPGRGLLQRSGPLDAEAVREIVRSMAPQRGPVTVDIKRDSNGRATSMVFHPPKVH